MGFFTSIIAMIGTAITEAETVAPEVSAAYTALKGFLTSSQAAAVESQLGSLISHVTTASGTAITVEPNSGKIGAGR